MLTIQLIRCDDRVIKQEFIEDTDKNDDNQLLQMG